MTSATPPVFSRVPGHLLEIQHSVNTVPLNSEGVNTFLSQQAPVVSCQIRSLMQDLRISRNPDLNTLITSKLEKSFRDFSNVNYPDLGQESEATLQKNFNSFKYSLDEVSKEFNRRIDDTYRAFVKDTGGQEKAPLDLGALEKQIQNDLQRAAKSIHEGNLELAFSQLAPIPNDNVEKARQLENLGKKFLGQKNLANALKCHFQINKMTTEKYCINGGNLLTAINQAVIDAPAMLEQAWPFIAAKTYPHERSLFQHISQALTKGNLVIKSARLEEAYQILTLRIELDRLQNVSSYLSASALASFDSIHEEMLNKGNIKEAIKMAAFAKKLNIVGTDPSQEDPEKSLVYTGNLIKEYLKKQKPEFLKKHCQLIVKKGEDVGSLISTYVDDQIKQCVLPDTTPFAEKVKKLESKLA